MSAVSHLSRFALLVGRALIMGVGFGFALMIGGMTMSILGLPLPSFGGKPKPFLSLVSSLVAGVLMGLTLGPLSRRLRLPFLGRGCLWLVLLLVLNGAINKAPHLTPVLRLAHGLEITADAFVQGFVLTWLLSPPDEATGELGEASTQRE